MSRDMTVGELRELLAEYPEHQLVAPVLAADPDAPMVGILTGVQLVQRETLGHICPVLLVGEI